MNPDPIELLYCDHHRWLCEWLRRTLGCTHQAADIAQDTFVRVLAGRPARDAVAVREPRAYLRTIARGLVIDHWRHQDLERAYADAVRGLPEPLVPAPELRLQLLQALAAIDAMLDGLAPNVRTAFLMVQLDGRSYRDVAEYLGVTVRSVERYMAAALLRCYEMRHGL